MEVIKMGDQNELVATEKYPSYAKFPFPKFNPVQSRICEIYNQDCNAIIAANTSSGKTICSELFAAHEIREKGGKVVYLAPLKALAQEKVQDWTDQSHHFADLKISICTGDWRLTPDRKKELEKANIIIFSTEMFNSRIRNFKSESNDFLKDVGVVIADECHLLTVPGRGDHLEVGLMKFSEISPNARHVFLSATMPNVDEIAKWMSKLTNKKTFLIESKYRPCPLGVHFEQYIPTGYYEDTEKEKVQAALQIVIENNEDKFLLFAHTKRTGEMMKQVLIDSGYEAEFHSADLTKEKRIALETKFREGKLQCIVATSTLAWGCNLPARRVVILGVHRGMSEVETYDISQMCVSGDARIMQYNNKNLYKLAKDISIGDVVAGVKDNKLTSGVINKIYKSKRNAKKITFTNGTEIVVSNHPLLSWDNKWVDSDEIKIGDKICTMTVSVKSGGESIWKLLENKIVLQDHYCSVDKNLLKKFRGIYLGEICNYKKRKQGWKIKKTGIMKISSAFKLGLKPIDYRSKNGAIFNIPDNISEQDFCWFLGALASDGNVKFNKSHSCLRFQVKDKNLFDKWCSVASKFGKVLCYINKKNGCYAGELHNFVLTSAIVALGITPKKSLTISMPLLFSLTKKQKIAFVHGVIDGDGSCGKNGIVRIATVSRIFANQLKQILLECNIRSTISIRDRIGKKFTIRGEKEFTTLNLMYMVNICKENVISLKEDYNGWRLNNYYLGSLKKKTRPKSGDLFYTRVKNIEKTSNVELYNFEVSDHHTFIIDDIVTHNCGRAGRPQYDPRGDVYILIPDGDAEYWIKKINNQQPITSRLLDHVGDDDYLSGKKAHYKTLAFHLVSEIHHGNIKNKEEVKKWYERSLAHSQAQDLEDHIVDNTLELLIKCGAIKEENGQYKATVLGMVSSMFYYSPFDVADLKRNFKELFSSGEKENDLLLTLCLGNIDSQRMGIVSKAERVDMKRYCDTVGKLFGEKTFTEAAMKAGFCYYNLINGQNPGALATTARMLQWDYPRMSQVLQAIDGLSGKWKETEYFKEIEMRIAYGVPTKYVNLCKIPDIGRIRAEKLYSAGLTTVGDVANNLPRVISILNLSPEKCNKICEAAKLMELTS